MALGNAYPVTANCSSRVPTETHMMVMVFSKAFDKVPHRRLLYKLEWYGIRGGTLDWIKWVLDGTEFLPGPILSGEHQGSVLGHILFLICIKDLPDGVTHSTVRLFADDCILYRHVTDKSDIIRRQMDIDRIAKWEETWLMEFNVGKCFVIRVGRQRGRSKIEPPTYILHDQVLCITDTTKYLGLTITSALKWNSHIQKVTSKSNSVLGRWPQNSFKNCEDTSLWSVGQTTLGVCLHGVGPAYTSECQEAYKGGLPAMCVTACLTSAVCQQCYMSWAGNHLPDGEKELGYA